MKRLRAIQLLVIVLSMLLCLSLTGCKDKNEITTDGKILVASVNYLDDTWEIYRNTDTSDLSSYIFKNSEFNSTERSSAKVFTNILNLPTVELSKELDKSEKITDYTYKTSMVQALEYVNFLKSEGYTEKLTARTSDFYEVYLEKEGSDKYIRLIIAPGYLIEYATNQLSFKITDYII